MPSDGHASPCLAEFAPHERQGRVEPELGPSTVPRTAYATVTSDLPVAAGLSGVVSEIDLEPRLFDFVPREAQLTSAPSRSAPTDRPHIGSVFYLLLVGLVAAAIIGVFFGVGVSLLTLPKDHTVVSAGPVPPGAEEAVSTAKAAPSPGDPPATIVASPGTAPVPDPTSHMPDSPASPPQVNSSAAAAEFAGPGAPTRSASGGSRSRAHTAIRRGQSAHHYRQPPAQAEKQRILSASMDRPHRENSADSFPSLTPPRAGTRNPFELLITHLTEQTKPAQSLTPPRTEQP
jgi:hypothetical protein